MFDGPRNANAANASRTLSGGGGGGFTTRALLGLSCLVVDAFSVTATRAYAESRRAAIESERDARPPASAVEFEQTRERHAFHRAREGESAQTGHGAFFDSGRERGGEGDALDRAVARDGEGEGRVGADAIVGAGLIVEAAVHQLECRTDAGFDVRNRGL